MKVEIMDALLKSASDPNKAPEALSQLREAIMADNDTLEANNVTIGKLNEDIATLRDTNQRLFLRVTGDEADEPAHEETTEELNERLRKQIFGD